jgi:FtsZ-binding cell division protein ZapB
VSFRDDHAVAPGELPSLGAFDQEFGRGAPAPRRPLRLRPWAGLLLGAIIISVPALAWLSADGGAGLDRPAEPIALQSAAAEQIGSLLREVAELKQEVSELTEAQQQAAETIATLRAAEQEMRAPPAYWYSDLAALNFAAGDQARPPLLAPARRRSATARSEPREIRSRGGAAPLSLEPAQ